MQCSSESANPPGADDRTAAVLSWFSFGIACVVLSTALEQMGVSTWFVFDESAMRGQRTPFGLYAMIVSGVLAQRVYAGIRQHQGRAPNPKAARLARYWLSGSTVWAGLHLVLALAPISETEQLAASVGITPVLLALFWQSYRQAPARAQ